MITKNHTITLTYLLLLRLCNHNKTLNYSHVFVASTPKTDLYSLWSPKNIPLHPHICCHYTSAITTDLQNTLSYSHVFVASTPKIDLHSVITTKHYTQILVAITLLSPQQNTKLQPCICCQYPWNWPSLSVTITEHIKIIPKYLVCQHP